MILCTEAQVLVKWLWDWSHYARLVAGRGLLSTLGNELSAETCLLTKHETLWGMGAWAESSRVREPRGNALPQSQ